MYVRIISLAAALVCAFPATSLAGGSRSTGQSQPPVVVRVMQGGFRWGDAAIGATAASGIALVLYGTSLIRRQLQKEER
jgi:hypothetical protein